jgi:hypothetical protein
MMRYVLALVGCHAVIALKMHESSNSSFPGLRGFYLTLDPNGVAHVQESLKAEPSLEVKPFIAQKGDYHMRDVGFSHIDMVQRCKNEDASTPCLIFEADAAWPTKPKGQLAELFRTMQQEQSNDWDLALLGMGNYHKLLLLEGENKEHSAWNLNEAAFDLKTHSMRLKSTGAGCHGYVVNPKSFDKYLSVMRKRLVGNSLPCTEYLEEGDGLKVIAPPIGFVKKGFSAKICTWSVVEKNPDPSWWWN